MIDILSKSRINNIPLDISREELLKLDYSAEQFRICFSQNNQFVRSISVIVTDVFRIDGELVELSQITEWYRKENPFVDGNTCIFPNKNLAIWNNNGVFEITLYSNREKSLYERSLTSLSTYNAYVEIKHLPDVLSLKPYIGLDILELGCNTETAHKILGKPLETGQRKTGAFGNGAYFEEYHNLILRYDDDTLTEIHFTDIPNIYYDEMNLAAPHWRLLKSVNAKLLNSVFMLVTRFSGLQTLSHFSNDYIGVGALKLGSPIFHECRTIHFQPDC